MLALTQAYIHAQENKLVLTTMDSYRMEIVITNKKIMDDAYEWLVQKKVMPDRPFKLDDPVCMLDFTGDNYIQKSFWIYQKDRFPKTEGTLTITEICDLFDLLKMHQLVRTFTRPEEARKPTKPEGSSATAIIALATGLRHSLFVTNDGRLWAMGDNYNGQLGTGNTMDRLSPELVTSATNVIAAATGLSHSLYITNDGKLWAMGWNRGGQLGVGDVTDRSTPAQVISATNATSVAAGWNNSLYTTSDGKLWGMGFGYPGHTPDWSKRQAPKSEKRTDDKPKVVSQAIPIDDLMPLELVQRTPVQVPSIPNIIAVAYTTMHSLYITGDGKLWAMGSNSYGQLGVRHMDDTATPVQVTSASNVIAVAAGDYYTLYVTGDGNLYAIGWNSHEQMGTGGSTRDTLFTPALVATNVTAVAVGRWHSLYITSDGKLWAMGLNEDGQLGTGDTLDRHAPVQVAANVTAVAAGDRHSLYATRDGKLWAMGNNRDGQLGTGDTLDRHTPTLVFDLSDNSKLTPEQSEKRQ